MKRTLAAAALLGLLAAGCAADPAPAAAPTVTPTPTASPGPEAFLAYLRTAPFGTQDFSGASDAQLLGIGSTACSGFDSDLTFGQVRQVYRDAPARPSTEEAETLIEQAVLNLCPHYKVQLIES